MRYLTIVFLFVFKISFALETGWLNPSATGEDYNQFTNPGNAYSSNESWANETTVTQKQDYYNFGIPDLSAYTIDSIVPSIEGSASSGSNTATIEIELSWNGGATYTNANIQRTWSGEVDTYRSFSGGKFGVNFVPADLTNTNFRLRLELIATTNNSWVDHVRIKIYYSIPVISNQYLYYNSISGVPYYNNSTGVFYYNGGTIPNPDPDTNKISEANATVNNLNIYYQNDFESSPLGGYNQSRWISEFNNAEPNGGNVLAQTTIVNSPAGRTGKVINFNFPAGSVGCCDGSTPTPDVDPPYEPIINGGTVSFFRFAKRDEIYLQYWIRWDNLSQGWVGNAGGGGKLLSFMLGNWLYATVDETGTRAATCGVMFGGNGVPQFYLYWPDNPEPEYGWGKTIYWGLPLSSYYPGGINWMHLKNEVDPSGGYHTNRTKAHVSYTSGTPKYMTDGQWHNIAVRGVVNTFKNGVPQKDGFLEGYWDGVMEIQLDSIQFRLVDTLQISTFRLTTFFGGAREYDGDMRRANVYEMNMQNDNIKIYNYDTTEVDVPGTHELSPTNRVLKLF